MDKDLIIQLQHNQLQLQLRLNDELQTVIKKLEARIIELENNQKRDSSNSSKPPSTDTRRVQHTQSLRTKSGKKPGGQPGHPGQTLCLSATPDKIIIHHLKQCNCCGKNLNGSVVADYECRQVFDIPPIKMLVTEHKSEIKTCPHCSVVSSAAFPDSVSQPVQYGTNVQQMAVYFTHYQLLPYQRTAQIFKDLFAHSLSSSFLVTNNQRCALNVQPFIEDLKVKLLDEPVLHADETGFYFEGNRNWLHTISTEQHSYYAVHTKRGIEAMQGIGILPHYEGTLVHDFWKSYHDFGCNHGLCNVHHLRDLTFCHEIEQSEWAARAKQLLLDVHEKVQAAKDAGAGALSKSQLQYWSRKYDDLVSEGERQHPVAAKQKGKRGVAKKSKTQNMIERFRQYKDEVLVFATNFLVPFSNNLAEQAIRMMKVKQKISGCFRSQQGAQDFADIRSYIATMKKQGVSIIKAIGAAIQGSPFYSSA